jgi:hypothetical protein
MLIPAIDAAYFSYIVLVAGSRFWSSVSVFAMT